MFLIGFPMGYMAYKNNKINHPRFREEGICNARYGKILITLSIIYLALLVYTAVEAYHSQRSVLLFWIIFFFTTAVPIIPYLAVLLPKVSH